MKLLNKIKQGFKDLFNKPENIPGSIIENTTLKQTKPQQTQRVNARPITHRIKQHTNGLTIKDSNNLNVKGLSQANKGTKQIKHETFNKATGQVKAYTQIIKLGYEKA